MKVLQCLDCQRYNYDVKVLQCLDCQRYNYDVKGKQVHHNARRKRQRRYTAKGWVTLTWKHRWQHCNNYGLAGEDVTIFKRKIYHCAEKGRWRNGSDKAERQVRLQMRSCIISVWCTHITWSVNLPKKCIHSGGKHEKAMEEVCCVR